MESDVSRRQFLVSGIGGSLALFSGCSELRDTQRKPIELTVFNVTEKAHRIEIEVIDEESPIVKQKAEIAAAKPNDGTRIETTIWLESYPKSSTLNIRATLDQNIQTTETIQVNCRPTQQGEDIIVRILSRDEMDISDSCI